MYLIAGLGNPGIKYEKTRHNIGFLVIDEITKALETSKINNPQFKSQLLKYKSNLYCKPQTFMNTSGESIVAIAHYYKIANRNIIIVHDDLDLAFGTIKFKLGGGHGGHNGLRSIDEHIGKDYLRVRFGIGKPEQKSNVVNYVLNDFTKNEFEKIDSLIQHCIKSIDALQRLELNEVKSAYTFKLQGN